MTYSIINTEHNELHSTYPTAKLAGEALHEMTHVVEYIDGRDETKATTAIYKYRVRNDETGDWVSWEEWQQ